MKKFLNDTDESYIRELLMGRRIVEVHVADEKERMSIQGRYGGTEIASGKLTLDNGREIYVIPNEGCGGCTSGWYDLKSLERVDNIITRVDFEVESSDDVDYYNEYSSERVYRIFVLAGHERINALTVEGDDGNGYYGTGYELVVIDPN